MARAQSAPPARDISGLYIYMSQVGGPNRNWDPVYEAALAENYIDGAAIVLRWDRIEPQSGVYDWSGLDNWVVKTVDLHKRLAIGVIAGAWTPDWLYWSGVPDNVFTHYDRDPPHGACGTIDQPVVWNPFYLQSYDAMMQALSNHLHTMQIPGQPAGAAYAALRIVKLGGINLTTEELRIDAHPPGGPCGEPDSAAIWAASGYTPQKILAAWMNIATATETAFPDKELSVAVIHKDGFPPIDHAGRIDATAALKPVAPDPMLVAILEAAAPVFHERLMVQWNALSQFVARNGAAVLPQEVLDAGADGTRIGWQMNEFLGVWGGSGCIYPPFKISPCRNLDDFQAILDNGIDHGGVYIEVQPVSVAGQYLRLAPGALTNFAPAFAEAHGRLANQP